MFIKILALLTSLLNLFLLAAVITSGWEWFLVPLGVSDLKNYAHALGISTLASLLNGSIGVTIKLYNIDSEFDPNYAFKLFLVYLFGYVMLFVFHLFY